MPTSPGQLETGIHLREVEGARRQHPLASRGGTMQETTNEETDLQKAQGAFLSAVTNMPAYDGSQNLESSMANALVQGLSIFSADSVKEMLSLALNSVTEYDRKVRYEADIQEHVAAGGKYVNIYVIDHDNYGDSAEGGWYYTSGTPMSIGYNHHHDDPDYKYHSDDNVRGTTKVHALDDAERVAHEVDIAVEKARVNNGELDDIVYEELYRVVIEDRPAEYWPAVKPHYQ